MMMTMMITTTQILFVSCYVLLTDVVVDFCSRNFIHYLQHEFTGVGCLGSAWVFFFNPLQRVGVRWLHSGTLALRTERQSARMSEIKNVG